MTVGADPLITAIRTADSDPRSSAEVGASCPCRSSSSCGARRGCPIRARAGRVAWWPASRRVIERRLPTGDAATRRRSDRRSPRPADARVRGGRRLDEPEVDRTRLETLEDRSAVRHVERDRVVGSVGQEPVEPRRQEILRDGVARGDPQQAGLTGAAATPRRCSSASAASSTAFAHPTTSCPSGVGRDPVGDRSSTVTPELAFERADPAARRRLGDAMRLGGPRQAAQLDDRPEQVECGQFGEARRQRHRSHGTGHRELVYDMP